MGVISEAGCKAELILKKGGLDSPQLQALLLSHRQQMFAFSPPDSVHAMKVNELSQPNVHLFSLWSNDELAGCGAIKIHSPALAEVKSMRTADSWLRKGVAAEILRELIREARLMGIEKLCLETGTGESFQPAISLYTKVGFIPCGPFADYAEDPFSCFMQMSL